jgi:hypothetical protein
MTKMLLSDDKATNCSMYIFLADMFGILNHFPAVSQKYAEQWQQM